MKLSIVIPIFNEADNIIPLYEKLIHTLTDLKYDFEILYINDGSTDNSRKMLKEIAKMDDKVKIINLRRNFGQTAAMMAGIDFSTGDVIIPMDGDLQNDPKDIPLLLEKLEEGYDVCSGWRKNRKDNFLIRKLPSKIANVLISGVSGVHLHDYGCTLKAYKKDIIKEVKLYGEMHRFVPVFAHLQGGKVTEVPVEHHPRIHGKSKYGLVRTFKVILDLMLIKFLLNYSHAPIYFFGGFGLLSFLFSFVIFLLMIYFKYCGDKNFMRTPLPILVAIFCLVGFQSIFMGLIAEILMRTYYESQDKSVYIVDKRPEF